MLIVALTGGIASGKSVVAGFLRERGCAVHSADTTAHEVVAPGSPAWKSLVDHFGAGILNADRTIDRRRLGAVVFSEEKERLFLNSVIHPLVMKKKREAVERLEKEGRHKIFISEAALTIESGFVSFYDKVIVVFCLPEIQEERLMARDGISRDEARRKIRAQMPVEAKKSRADYLIDSSGSKVETEKLTDVLFRRLVLDYEEKERRGGNRG
ncbi:MAG: dephospho-CoA kinase [Candidatus Aminicenantes bacterium RBG_13_63_10]|nr:MAG: dephospho-CoA kinase [Candidatus Aminicenantes bacterium RBG_13_63_10]